MRALLLTLLLACLPGQLLAAGTLLSVCSEASPEGFDVVQYNSLTTTNASADMLMNRLVEFDAERASLVPSLARAWQISEDGRVYDFQLRDDVHFHQTDYFSPSRLLTAEDVLFSFRRMIDPAHPWHASAPRGYPHAQSMGWPQLIEQIEAPSPQQLRITLRQADATFLSSLSMGFASIYSAEYAAQLQASGTMQKLNSQPIGTGPFVFRRYQKDAVVRYRPHPQYFAGAAKVDALIFAITPDSNVRLQKLRRGECHIALSPRPLDLQSTSRDPRLQAAGVPAFMTAFVAINSQHPPLDKVEVRQAINLAFDRASYLSAVFSNAAVAANGPLPPSAWGYAEAAEQPRDLARARDLLKQAGLADGFDTTIWTRPSGSLLNPNPSLGAQLLQADLAQIGIRAQIQVIEWGELIRRAKAGEHDLLFMGWAGDNGDPDNFLTPQFSCAAVSSGTNFARYCDTQLDRLISQARTVADPLQRSALYQQAQQLIRESALWVPLAHPTASALLRQGVQGYQVNPFGRQDFSRVTPP
jgi:ABC-type transport system substrate-binding protein